MSYYVTPQEWVVGNWRSSFPALLYVGAFSLVVFVRNIFTKGAKWNLLIANPVEPPIAVKIVFAFPFICVTTVNGKFPVLSN